MINNKNKLKEIATKLEEYFDIINFHSFSEEEKQEGIDYIIVNVEDGNSEEVIKMLMEEYNEVKDNDLLELIEELKNYINNLKIVDK